MCAVCPSELQTSSDGPKSVRPQGMHIYFGHSCTVCGQIRIQNKRNWLSWEQWAEYVHLILHLHHACTLIKARYSTSDGPGPGGLHGNRHPSSLCIQLRSTCRWMAAGIFCMDKWNRHYGRLYSDNIYIYLAHHP